MSALERVVRPFQSPNISTGPRVVTARRRSIGDAELKWGAVGKLPEGVLNAAGFNTKKEDDTEISYKYEDVKIKQPDNPNNYVIVRRKTELTLHKAESGSALTSTQGSGASGNFSTSNGYEDFTATGGFRPADTESTPTGNADVTVHLKVDKENTEPVT